MKKCLTTVVVLGSLLGASAAPVLENGEMELLQSYQYKVDELPEPSATSTPKERKFTDDDNNNLISVSVFLDSRGEIHEEQISDELYANLGKEGGYLLNPKKIERASPASKLLPKKAKAAIGFDDTTQTASIGAVSSVTYAHTTTGSNRLLVVCSYFASSRNVTSTTYNGVELTDVVAQLDTGGGERYAMEYLIAPATGANNVVVTLDGTSGMESVAGTYTGVDQTDAIDATRTEIDDENVNSYSEAITSTVDNTWAVWCTRNYSGVVVSAGANTALREQVLVNFGVLFADSNAAITPAGSRTMTLTSAISSHFFSDILVTINPLIITFSSTGYDFPLVF